MREKGMVKYGYLRKAVGLSKETALQDDQFCRWWYLVLGRERRVVLLQLHLFDFAPCGFT